MGCVETAYKTMKYIIYIVGIAIAMAALAWMSGAIWERQEVYECTKWAKEAKEYRGYYLLEWQAKQCEYRNIVVDAEVK